jgi:uncharacterized protein (DUF433 family)
MEIDQIVHRDPGILGGVPVFHGSRVPIRSLFDHLQGGDTVEEFLHQFPSVRREQVIGLLAIARDSILTDACAA